MEAWLCKLMNRINSWNIVKSLHIAKMYKHAKYTCDL